MKSLRSLWIAVLVLLVGSSGQLVAQDAESTDTSEAEQAENNTSSAVPSEPSQESTPSADAAANAEESVATPDVFIPSEDISEDYAVPFPVDI